ncbi:hypothetical protein TRFO_19387 [Tritrichomonas foetus]|uniref:Uncharacterized protein n=1 Tax=Tritrichomonas foetus TaxID=1144522 RepID=A0A1J4KK08_9EUKA|nr:hypothetical protein TRFO_19387 [Tritrichomonas foetus]|eukprot:OHT11280.1 hypothetical protein TRFO_19387 [Tritrichomonas foetus]
MLIFFFLFAFFRAEEITLYGNWSDSYFYNEVLMFFEEIDKYLIASVEKSLDNVMDINLTSVLDTLEPIIRPDIFGLLNLSLTNRYFQLKSMVKVPKVRSNPQVSGWSVFCKRNKTIQNINSSILKNFQWMLVSGLEIMSTPKDKLEYLHQFATDFHNFAKRYSFFEKFYNSPFNDFSKRKYMNSKLNFSKGSYVNNRTCGHSILEVIKCLVEESKINSTRINQFNLSNEQINQLNQITQITSMNSADELFYYTKQAPSYCGVRLTDHLKHSNERHYSDSFNTDEISPIQFLHNQSPMITIDIYFSLNSPEYLPLLDIALKIEKSYLPITTNVYVIPHYKNETEKKMCFAFMDLISLGGRPPIFFLEESLKHPVKQAYSNSYPKTKWSDLKTLYNEGPTLNKIKELEKYCNDHGIKSAAVAVNGEFIREQPVFPHIMSEVNRHAARMQKFAQLGKIQPSDNIKQWIKENAILTDSIHPDVFIDERNYLSMDGFSTIEMKEIIMEMICSVNFSNSTNENNVTNEIHNNEDFYHHIYNVDLDSDNNFYNDYLEALMSDENYINDENDIDDEIYMNNSFKSAWKNKVPVFFVNYPIKYNLSNTVSIKVINISVNTQKFLRVNQNDKCTIVGPLKFNGKMNETTLTAAVRYVNFLHSKNLPKLPFDAYVYELFLSGHRKITKISNIPRTKCYSFKVGNSPQSFRLEMSPFDPEFPMAIDTAKQIADSGAATVEIVPLIPLNEMKKLPDFLLRKHKRSVNGTVKCKHGIYSYEFPSQWLVAFTDKRKTMHNINISSDMNHQAKPQINSTHRENPENYSIINEKEIDENNTTDNRININIELENKTNITIENSSLKVNQTEIPAENETKIQTENQNEVHKDKENLELNDETNSTVNQDNLPIERLQENLTENEFNNTSNETFQQTHHPTTQLTHVSTPQTTPQPTPHIEQSKTLDLFIDSIMAAGFLDNADVVQIGEKQRIVSSFRGLFMVKLVPGKSYEAIGINQPSFTIDSLIPSPNVYGGNGDRIIMKERDVFSVLTTNIPNKLNHLLENKSLNYQKFNLTDDLFDNQNVNSSDNELEDFLEKNDDSENSLNDDLVTENYNYISMLHSIKKHATKNLKMHVIVDSPVSLHDFHAFNSSLNFIPLYLPPVLSPPKSKKVAAQLLSIFLIDTMFMSRVLVTSPEIVWLKDATQFENVFMKKAVVAIPEMAIDKKMYKKLDQLENKVPWMRNDYLALRMGRPFHNTAIMWFDVRKWSAKYGLQHFVNLYEHETRSNDHIEVKKDPIQHIMNILQLKIQFLTMTPRVGYCMKYSPNKRMIFTTNVSLVSVRLCDNSSINLVREQINEILKEID